MLVKKSKNSFKNYHLFYNCTNYITKTLTQKEQMTFV